MLEMSNHHDVATHECVRLLIFVKYSSVRLFSKRVRLFKLCDYMCSVTPKWRGVGVGVSRGALEWSWGGLVRV